MLRGLECPSEHCVWALGSPAGGPVWVNSESLRGGAQMEEMGQWP